MVSNMKKDGKYRFSLQFGMGSEDEIRAGELLENLGNKKSKVLIAALNEYMDNHPELQNGSVRINVDISSMPMELLEMKINEILEKRMGGIETVDLHQVKDNGNSVDQDIVDMLDDLELFQF